MARYDSTSVEVLKIVGYMYERSHLPEKAGLDIRTHCTIPGLISCTEMTRRWGLLSNVQCSQVAGFILMVSRSSLKVASLHRAVF